MPATIATAIEPDTVIGLQLRPGTYRTFRDSLAEGGPRLKCFKGGVTLVSPGQPHETAGNRLASLILAVASVLRVPHTALGSTTWELPEGAEDTGYEADESYYVQSHGLAPEGHRPDLAIEVVVSNPETKAMRCGQLLEIPEIWVLDLNRHRLTFFQLADRGPGAATYRPEARSRAFPFLEASAVLERLDDPETDAVAFHENCRAWAERALRPLREGAEENNP